MIASFARAGRFLGMLFAAFAITMAVSVPTSLAQDGTPHLLLELETGTVDIELLPELAPQHVERIIELTERGFYDGVVFHRVIEGFMAQTGDPTGTGMGGSELPDLPAEFSDVPFTRGVVAAARTADPNSANSQFFITYADAPHLSGQYTVWGRVVDGMDAVDAVKKGDPGGNGQVQDPDAIVSATIEYR
jgi:peptidylprolyl isomerase